MKAKELINIGYKQGPVIGLLLKACEEAKKLKISAEDIRSIVNQIYDNPSLFLNREIWSVPAEELFKQRNPDKQTEYKFEDKEFTVFGKELIDENAMEQMKNCMRLPISVTGSMMSDSHPGYGLPIGGVVATDNTVIPYGVGVDIGCRFMLSVLPIQPDEMKRYRPVFHDLIKEHTRFGKGVGFEGKLRKNHPVMDEDWSFSKIAQSVKDLAWIQIGSSGSGNHFFNVCEINYNDGRSFICILTHSGSRGAGNKIATFYSELAQSIHPDLPKEYKYLAWLDMEKEEGIEYWKAMELMGRYASANHHLIHGAFCKSLGVKPVQQVENFHNFCWKENVNGKDLYIHRKGATPAGEGVMGVIGGSMATPSYLVVGKGNITSLQSASHGAGRSMSRKATKEVTRWSQVKGMLKERNVELISAGLDEVPVGYKNIKEVMAAQKELVEIVAEINPRIVVMAPEGEQPED